MASKHYAVIVGARPNFIKAAPLLKTFDRYNVKYTLIHTGQHYDRDMSLVFFQQLGLPEPDIHLTGDIFAGLRTHFAEHTYSGTIVFGDVDSTLAGAIGAFTNGQDVFHVEAGLRSFDERMPEERNRKVIDHLSKIHFVSEPAAIDNLRDEGIDSYVEVGNIMIESLEMFENQIDASDILSIAEVEGISYVVVTIHRRENVQDPERLKYLLGLVAKLNEYVKVIFPIHPGTGEKIEEANLWPILADVFTTYPIGYFSFMKLVKNSLGVVTDSGGIQEETTHLGIPCCTLRNNTERPITVAVGSNKLFPEGMEDVEDMLTHLYVRFDKAPVPMWDRKVSTRIYENLCSHAND